MLHHTQSERYGLPDVFAAAAELDGLLVLGVIDPQTATILVSHWTEAAGSDDLGVHLAAGVSDAVRSLAVLAARVSPDSALEDVVVTLVDHHYLIRLVTLEDGDAVAVVLVLARQTVNLAMALRVLRYLPGVLPEFRSNGASVRTGTLS
ncbi:hypothetical protein [Kineosporia sp. R_H_3]|uniref:hypothetical protein n=1 Tax=Kineosporia sp. R_H_3 TaxID=1961848 RepID=UPI000B4AE8E1|nr:hypothetical protein [Kineosporia sp. R_H_3]